MLLHLSIGRLYVQRSIWRCQEDIILTHKIAFIRRSMPITEQSWIVIVQVCRWNLTTMTTSFRTFSSCNIIVQKLLKGLDMLFYQKSCQVKYWNVTWTLCEVDFINTHWCEVHINQMSWLNTNFLSLKATVPHLIFHLGEFKRNLHESVPFN